MSPSPLASESTTSLPLWSTFLLMSIPRFEKNPFWTPRSSGSAFAMFSVRRSIVASFLPGELDAEPPRSASEISADRIAAARNLRLIPVLPFDRCSYRNRKLPLDQPVHVRPQVYELGQLLRD